MRVSLLFAMVAWDDLFLQLYILTVVVYVFSFS